MGVPTRLAHCRACAGVHDLRASAAGAALAQLLGNDGGARGPEGKTNSDGAQNTEASAAARGKRHVERDTGEILEIHDGLLSIRTAVTLYSGVPVCLSRSDPVRALSWLFGS